MCTINSSPSTDLMGNIKKNFRKPLQFRSPYIFHIETSVERKLYFSSSSEANYMISKFNAHTLDLSKITETKNHRNYTDECFKTLKISGSRIRI